MTAVTGAAGGVVVAVLPDVGAPLAGATAPAAVPAMATGAVVPPVTAVGAVVLGVAAAVARGGDPAVLKLTIFPDDSPYSFFAMTR